MLEYNRVGVIRNDFQGKSPRILCVCSGGVLRSPTTAHILSSPPYDFNTRAAGTEEYALIRVDEALLLWADGIIIMEEHHSIKVRALLDELGIVHPPIATLDIPDRFAYRDPRLVKLINERLPAKLGNRITIKS